MTTHEFKVGDYVAKIGGRYGGPGQIVGDTIGLDASGHKLWNVAMKVEGGYGRFVHVFPSGVLVPRGAAARSVSLPVQDVERIARLICKGCNHDPDALNKRAERRGHSIPEWMLFMPAAELVLAEAAGGTEALADIRRDRDEADMRAGAALRRVAWLEEEVQKTRTWIADAKASEGRGDHIPFDEVWADLRNERDSLRCDLAAATNGEGEAIGAWREDKARLDWLDGVNAGTNRRNGTRYGWKFDINHNRAALADCHHPPLSVREALDSARFPDLAPQIARQCAAMTKEPRP